MIRLSVGAAIRAVKMVHAKAGRKSPVHWKCAVRAGCLD
jgi:hypothetical protein